MGATLNLASVLAHTARITPDRIAVTGGGESLTYSALDARAAGIAAGLHAAGIRAGDHVALSCPNLPWFPILYFGILKAGAAVVPLNVLLKPREIAYHLKDSRAAALLAFEGSAELPIGTMCEQAAQDAGCPRVFLFPRDAATLSASGGSFEPPRREPHDAAAAALRICVSGGAPMPVDVLQAFERTFGVRVLEGYGLSETAPVVAFNQLQRPSKPGTVGTLKRELR